MIDNEDMETNDALEELGDTDGYSIPGLGAGLDVSRAPSKLALESRITSPTSTRIKSTGKKMDAPGTDRTKNSRHRKNEIDTCPRAVL